MCLAAPLNNSRPAGEAAELISWYRRGREAYFDLTTGRRNIKCELCAGAVDDDGALIGHL